MSPGSRVRAPQGAYIFFKCFSANGGVVYRDELKPRYLRMRRFEPCFAQIFILIISFGLLLIFIPTFNTITHSITPTEKKNETNFLMVMQMHPEGLVSI